MKLIDLHAGLQFLPDLYEILNTRVPVDNWTYDGRNLVGTIFIDTEEYKIILEPGTFPVEQTVYTFINVAFAKIVSGEQSQDLTYTNKRGSAVIGAIAHVIYDKLPEFDADAVIFVARDNVDRRMRIYNYLASHATGNYSGAHHKPNIPLGGGALATVLFKNQLPRKDVDAFLQFIDTLKGK